MSCTESASHPRVQPNGKVGNMGQARRTAVILTTFALLVACFGLIACKKAETEEENRNAAYAGVWEAREIAFSDDPIDIDSVTFKLELNEDGTGTLTADDGSQDITWEVRGFTDPTIWVSIKDGFEINGVKAEIQALQLKEGLTSNSLSFNETWQTTLDMDGYEVGAVFHMKGALTKVS